MPRLQSSFSVIPKNQSAPKALETTTGNSSAVGISPEATADRPDKPGGNGTTHVVKKGQFLDKSLPVFVAYGQCGFKK